MPPNRPIRTVRTLSDFFAAIEESRLRRGEVELYRGHADKEFLLEPSLFREARHRRHEKNIRRELITVHPGEFREDAGTFENLVRMQHFSLPTRLLDLTYNPLVALYFTSNSHRNKDGEFITLRVPSANIRYFDSDTVSCIANLSNLSARERNELRRIDDADELATSHAGKRLLQFIRSEKSYFLPEIRPEDLKSIQVVKPKLNNRRIIAQQGAFLIFGLIAELENENDFEIEIDRIQIPARAKSKIIQDLDRVNVNRSSLYPEIDAAAQYIMEKLTPMKGEDEKS